MARTMTTAAEAGRFAYDGLDRTLHEKARLGIVTCLTSEPDGVRFIDLKRLCTLTDGNLSRHLEVLHEAGMVEIWKGFENRRPQTVCRLTPAGRRRFVVYLKELGRVLRDGMAKPKHAARNRAMPAGWQRR